MSQPPLAVQRLFLHIAGAMHEGNWLEALRAWQAVLEAVPDLRRAYAMVGAELHAGGRLDEADIVFADAVMRFPDDAAATVNHAWAAHARKNWPEARLRWQAVCERFTAEPSGPLMLGSLLLRQLDQAEQGEAILEAARERFPDHMSIAAELGWAAANRGDHETALARYDAIRTGSPDQPVGYQGVARALDALGRRDEADALLVEMTTRFPDDPGTLFQYAWHAPAEMESLRRWEAVRIRLPNQAIAHQKVASAMAQTGRIAEAEALLEEAVRRFPTHPAIATDYAMVAHARQDWAEALRRWNAAAAHHPDDETVRTRRTEAQSHLPAEATRLDAVPPAS